MTLERLFQPLGHVFNVLGRPFCNFHAEMEAHLHQNFLDFVQRLAPKVPSDIVLIAESGINNEADAIMMYESGADGLLIGTAIMEGDIGENTKRFAQIEI